MIISVIIHWLVKINILQKLENYCHGGTYVCYGGTNKWHGGTKICHVGTLELHRLLTSQKLITKKEYINQLIKLLS